MCEYCVLEYGELPHEFICQVSILIKKMERDQGTSVTRIEAECQT